MGEGEWTLFVCLVFPIPGMGAYPPVTECLCRNSGVGAVVNLAATAGVVSWAAGALHWLPAIGLIAPIYQLALLKYLYRRFVTRFERTPVHVWENPNPGLLPDRVFAVSVLLGGLVPVFGVVLLLL